VSTTQLHVQLERARQAHVGGKFVPSNDLLVECVEALKALSDAQAVLASAQMHLATVCNQHATALRHSHALRTSIQNLQIASALVCVLRS